MLDPECPAKALPEISKSIDAFQGGKYQLSNLHKCPEGCVITDGNKVFPSSEHRYQFTKLKAHDLTDEAFDLLDEPDPFKVMQRSKELLPDEKTSDKWRSLATSEMTEDNYLKFKSCAHARETPF